MAEWEAPETARRIALEFAEEHDLQGVSAHATGLLRDRLVRAVARAQAEALEEGAKRRRDLSLRIQKHAHDGHEMEMVCALLDQARHLVMEADSIEADAARYRPPAEGEGE